MREAEATASSPEPHNRLSVAPARPPEDGEQRTHAGDISIVLAG